MHRGVERGRFKKRRHDCKTDLNSACNSRGVDYEFPFVPRSPELRAQTALSSNGRTPDSDSGYLGSNPGGAILSKPNTSDLTVYNKIQVDSRSQKGIPKGYTKSGENMSTHPGILLTQKTNGGTWNVRFHDPRNKHIAVLRSTETKIYDVAKRIAEEFSRLIKNPDQWDSPPKELHPRTLKIWGANTDEQSAEDALKALDDPTLLKRADFDDKFTTLTLSELEHLTLKEGSRTMKVPTKVKSIVTRRLKTSSIVFPDDTGKPWPDPKMFDRRFLVALKAAGNTVKIPFELDCRVARRTCTTILLEAGVPVKAVADILGDDPATILEHYAGVMEGSFDPSAAAI